MKITTTTTATTALAITLLGGAQAQAQEPQLLWSDEFEQTSLDASVWSYDVGNGDNGWGNGELQVYAESNVAVEDGLLKIVATKEDDDLFTSGRIKTMDKLSFKYGTLEARMQTPDVNAGLWPAFWTLGANFESVGWPAAGEIDIAELGQGLAIEEGVANQRVVSAAHWEYEGQYASYANSYDSPQDLSQDFHTYKLEWTPEKMSTYVDDNLIWEMNIGTSECLDCEELHQPHLILFNLAVGGGFTSGGSSSSSSSSSSSGCSSSAGSSSSGGCPGRGPDDITAPLPAEMLVDWVRLYDNGFTEVNMPPTPAPSVPIANAQTQAPSPMPVTPRPTQAPVTPRPTQAPVTVPAQEPVTPPPTTSTPVRNPPTNPATTTSRDSGDGNNDDDGDDDYYSVDCVEERSRRSGGSGKGKGKSKGGNSGSRSRAARSGGSSKGGKGGKGSGSRRTRKGRRLSGKAGKGSKGKSGSQSSRTGCTEAGAYRSSYLSDVPSAASTTAISSHVSCLTGIVAVWLMLQGWMQN